MLKSLKMTKVVLAILPKPVPPPIMIKAVDVVTLLCFSATSEMHPLQSTQLWTAWRPNGCFHCAKSTKGATPSTAPSFVSGTDAMGGTSSMTYQNRNYCSQT